MMPIVISSPKDHPWEQSVTKMLVDEGLDTFHLRKPGYTLEQMKRVLESFPVETLKHIVLHSHWELADQYSLKGWHASVLPDKVENEQLTRSCSLHKLHECMSVKEKFDYAFISPVFDSISKQGHVAGFAPEVLQFFFGSEESSLQNCKWIALGGVSSEKCGVAMELGFHGVALLGAIWNQKEIHGAMKQFKQVRNICHPNLVC